MNSIWKTLFIVAILLSLVIYSSSKPNTTAIVNHQATQVFYTNKPQSVSNTSKPNTQPLAPVSRVDQASEAARSDLQLSPPTLSATAAEIESATTHADQFSNWLSQNQSPDFNFANEMQQRFEQETRDTFWAEQEEQKLQNAFSFNPEFSGIALREASCRTSQCMLAISVTSLEQANQLVELVARAIESENTFYTVIAAPDQQQGMTKLFISRAGNNFLFN